MALYLNGSKIIGSLVTDGNVVNKNLLDTTYFIRNLMSLTIGDNIDTVYVANSPRYAHSLLIDVRKYNSIKVESNLTADAYLSDLWLYKYKDSLLVSEQYRFTQLVGTSIIDVSDSDFIRIMLCSPDNSHPVYTDLTNHGTLVVTPN